MSLSILITAFNEPLHDVNETVASIRETAGDVEIILVDDGSPMALDLADKSVKLIRMEQRCGVGPARQVAATHATGDFLLITDAHMRFQKGWLDAAMKRIWNRPKTIHCATCVTLSPQMMDMARAQHAYTSGASINFHGPDRNRAGVMQVLESVWNPEQSGDDFPIASIMGACYFVPTDWFWHIGGLRLLRGWGSDETLLAVKTWLAGGECRAMKCVRIGHQFRTASNYTTESWNMLWNKMAISLTCFPMAKAWKLNSLLEGSGELTTAKRKVTEDFGLLMAEREYLQHIFTRDLEWYCNNFQLTFPSNG